MSHHAFRLKTLAFFCTIVLSAGLGRAAEVRLLPKAEVKTTIIRLGDVAEIFGDARDVAALKQLELAVAPTHGGVRSLSVHQVRDRLAERGVNLRKHRLSGAVKITIHNVAAPPATPTFGRVQSLPTSPLAKSKKRSTKDSKDYPKVVIATRTIRVGEVVGRGDVRLAESETKRPGFGVLRDVEGVIGMEARSVITAGRPVLDRNVQRPILVRRNSEAKLTVRSGSVRISTMVKVLSDGSLHDYVPVEAADSREKFSARVIGPREVEILAGQSTPRPQRLSHRGRYTLDRVARRNQPQNSAPLRTISYPRNGK